MTDEVSGITTNLSVAICSSPTEATRQGFFYRRPVYKPVLIEKAVIVKNGTVSGKDTVDLIMVGTTDRSTSLCCRLRC